jgi:hypothetical protein
MRCNTRTMRCDDLRDAEPCIGDLSVDVDRRTGRRQLARRVDLHDLPERIDSRPTRRDARAALTIAKNRPKIGLSAKSHFDRHVLCRARGVLCQYAQAAEAGGPARLRMLARAQRELLGDDDCRQCTSTCPSCRRWDQRIRAHSPSRLKSAGPKLRVPLLSRRLSPPRFQERSSCSIAFSRFLRARSMALASLGEILPEVISVSILS